MSLGNQRSPLICLGKYLMLRHVMWMTQNYHQQLRTVSSASPSHLHHDLKENYGKIVENLKILENLGILENIGILENLEVLEKPDILENLEIPEKPGNSRN